MDRRESLKLMAWGTVGAGVLLEACKNADKKTTLDAAASGNPYATLNRMPEEEEAYKKIIASTFFTEEEMATIAVLSDIIIPKDDVSGSATDAKVPDFIEFIVKEKTELVYTSQNLEYSFTPAIISEVRSVIFTPNCEKPKSVSFAVFHPPLA